MSAAEGRIDDERLATRAFWPTACLGLTLLGAVYLAPSVVERARLTRSADEAETRLAAVTDSLEDLRASFAVGDGELRVGGVALPAFAAAGPADPRPVIAWLTPLAEEGPWRTGTALAGATLLVFAWVWLTPERVGRVRAVWLTAGR